MMDIKHPSNKAQSSSDFDRGQILEENFFKSLDSTHAQERSIHEMELNQDQYLDLFDSQLKSRHLDLMARKLKQQGAGFHTIGSCGHEGNAAVALAFKHTDIAFLHYRSGAFMLQRAKKVADIDMVNDILLSLVAAKDDPIASGRHKVFGSAPLWVPPQTSTIASHLPKAVGTAASIKRAQSLKIDHPLPDDSVVLCSFGDASFNHAVAQSAFNTVRWICQSRVPLPLVFICEDNGLGVSVPTPKDWIEASVIGQPWLTYIQANGLSLEDTYSAAMQAQHIARVQRKPVFLHLKLVRLLGHAGTDFELGYRNLTDIQHNEAQDPLIQSAKTILSQGWLSADSIKQKYQDIKQRIHVAAEQVVKRKKLSSADEVMQSIIPPISDNKTPEIPSESQRQQAFADKFKKCSEPISMVQHINLALTDIMLQYNNTLIFGEDVGKKGGVYQATAGLQSRFGIKRVFDTLLDETTILGQAIGHAHNGFIPIPEIQFLAYLHNAEDQIRGEAATLPFFSNGQFTNPMVIRIAGLAYQKGFGGHFHNDNSIAVLRDIPGVIIACPSNGPDAAKMLRTCMQLAHVQRRVVVFIEPIALYMQKDLHEIQDRQWMFNYPEPNEVIEYGELGIYNADKSCDIGIITYGNGYYLSRQAEKILQEQHNINVKIIDLRWLAPLNVPAIIKQVQSLKSILIVDECRNTGSLAEQLQAVLLQNLNPLPQIKTITALDSFIPLGTAWKHVLPSKEDIVQSILDNPINNG